MNFENSQIVLSTKRLRKLEKNLEELINITTNLRYALGTCINMFQNSISKTPEESTADFKDMLRILTDIGVIHEIDKIDD
jgi:hypothetical protein